VSRVDDIVANETRSELVARGWEPGAADEAIAFRVFLRRAESGVEPGAPDHDYARGMGPLVARRYLEQVAPEELER
jgi:hypothetical protein